MEEKSPFESKLSRKSDAEEVVMEMVEAIIDNNSNENNLEFLPKSSKSDEGAQKGQKSQDRKKSRDDSRKRGKIFKFIQNLKFVI